MPLTSSSDTFSIMSKSLISTNPILCPSGGCHHEGCPVFVHSWQRIRCQKQPCLRWCTSASPRRVKCKFEFGSLGFCRNPRSSRTCAACQQPLYVSVDFQRNNYGMKSPTKKKIPPNNAAKQKKHVAQHYVSAHELLPRFLMTQVFPRGDAKNFYQKTV